MPEIACVVESNSILGEGAIWDPREAVLWWVDIWGKLIHRYDPAIGRNDSWPSPEHLGCLAVRERGGLVVSMKNGFHFFDPAGGRFAPIVDPEADMPDTRFNDGKTDRQGRFYSGTMFEAEGKPFRSVGSLYRLDPDLSCHRLVEGIGCSNGLAWSPDGKVMYFADSPACRVWAWDFDPATGEIANRRTFIDTSPTGGSPDGATVDAEGCYWLTLPITGKVARYDPAGKLMQTIALPTDLPTCCAFGGRNLDILYVTTATLRRPPEKIDGAALAGNLFALDVGVKGLPEAHFKG